MPFPGSQEDETIQVAYFIFHNAIYFRLAGLLLILPLLQTFDRGSKVIKVAICLLVGAYAVIFYFVNYHFLADKIFLMPGNVTFKSPDNSSVDPRKLILGIAIGKESKAYPIEIIGYHHQVRDIVGGEPVMVTYCTVCRTGRVYSPFVNGKPETFRLVGMDHYNAMFEDGATKSWWRQVSGEAIIGPLKGKKLKEIPSEQMSLGSWIILHPKTEILQPDTTFKDAYMALQGYDEGVRSGRLERRDLPSWKDKSWVLGIQMGMEARAYDWNDFQRMKVISDEIGGVPVVLVANPDSVSFHTYSRIIDNEPLEFEINSRGIGLVDLETGSVWNWNGQCESGVYKGKFLSPVQAYQEYWHSWKTFHPQTSRYEPR